MGGQGISQVPALLPKLTEIYFPSAILKGFFVDISSISEQLVDSVSLPDQPCWVNGWATVYSGKFGGGEMISSQWKGYPNIISDYASG